MGIRIACHQLAARTSLTSLLFVPLLLVAAACSENATEPVARELDTTPSLSLVNAQVAGLSGPIASKLAANKCMDQKSYGNAGQAVISTCDGAKGQTFTWKSNGSIVNSAGACVAANETRNGALILVKRCDGGKDQKWSATKAGEIRGIGGKCIGVAWNSPKDGTKLVLWPCNSTPSQKWDAQGVSASEQATSDLSVTGLDVASGKTYKVLPAGTKTGAVVYTDRSYRLASAPSAIAGATYIRTANDDKFAKLGSTSLDRKSVV